jgi:hypothetical protein
MGRTFILATPERCTFRSSLIAHRSSMGLAIRRGGRPHVARSRTRRAPDVGAEPSSENRRHGRTDHASLFPRRAARPSSCSRGGSVVHEQSRRPASHGPNSPCRRSCAKLAGAVGLVEV